MFEFRDIQAHLNQLYGVDVSPTLISNVTNRIMPLIKEWQSRPLQKTYAVVFLDAIDYKIKQEGHIVNKAVYMVIGIDMDGCKDVLGMYIGEHETSKFWLTVSSAREKHKTIYRPWTSFGGCGCTKFYPLKK